MDCALFAFVAWRIRKMSRWWSLAGLFLCLIEVTYFIEKSTLLALAALCILAVPFGNAVRGTFIFARERMKVNTTPSKAWQSVNGLGARDRIIVALVSAAAVAFGIYFGHSLNVPPTLFTKTVDSIEVWIGMHVFAKRFGSSATRN